MTKKVKKTKKTNKKKSSSKKTKKVVKKNKKKLKVRPKKAKKKAKKAKYREKKAKKKAKVVVVKKPKKRGVKSIPRKYNVSPKVKEALLKMLVNVYSPEEFPNIKKILFVKYFYNFFHILIHVYSLWSQTKWGRKKL